MVSRRHFLAAGVSASGLAASIAEAGPADTEPTPGLSSLLELDQAKLVARADLNYDKPASRSEEGMPLGNGRMGTLTCTTPSALKFQINRADVYPISGSTRSFPFRNADYGTSRGMVDIDFVDFGSDVFAGPAFQQHLSVYDALMTLRGEGVIARVLAWENGDVLAVEVDDRPTTQSPVRIELRMLRYDAQFHFRQNWALTKRHAVQVNTRNHEAASQLDIRDGAIVLKQEFREGEHFNASAVVIGIVARRSKAKFASDSACSRAGTGSLHNPHRQRGHLRREAGRRRARTGAIASRRRQGV
jgi:hypothetical protein